MLVSGERRKKFDIVPLNRWAIMVGSLNFLIRPDSHEIYLPKKFKKHIP